MLDELLKLLDPKRIPHHVAIIMDGNGRWATMRGKERFEGHRIGAEVARKIVEVSRRIGLGYLSLFAFSMENWGRPKEEVEFLMHLLELYLEKELPNLLDQGIRLVVCGDVESLPDSTKSIISRVVDRTKDRKNMVLNLVVSYGGRWDIVQAARSIARKVASGKISPEEIDEGLFKAHLSTASMPFPDLLIRTSGEMRISNFFLWDIAYTELYFTPTLWPDFSGEEFLKAILDYQRRERRFGLVG